MYDWRTKYVDDLLEVDQGNIIVALCKTFYWFFIIDKVYQDCHYYTERFGVDKNLTMMIISQNILNRL